MKGILFIALAVTLALGVGLMGCEGEGPPPELECDENPAISVLCNAAGYPTDPDQCVVMGNTLKVLHPDAPGNLGCPWQFSSGFETPQSDFAIERLLGLNQNAELCPQLATAWVNDPEDGDGGSITFTLREGVTFHDGSAFNATVCKWNLDWQAGLANPAAGVRDIKGFIDSIEVTGDYEVKLWMVDWIEDFDRYFMSTGAGRMVSKAAYDALEGPGFVKDQWMKENPIGTGPFEFESYDGSTLLRYVKYDDYWQEGLPYLDAVEIHYVPNEMTRLFAFQTGEYHVMNDMSTSTAAELINAGYVVTSRVVNIEGLGPDSLEGLFANQDMREMLAMAVDYEPLVDSLCNGMFEYTGQLALESVDDLGLASGWNATMEGYPYDQEAAKDILEGYGYNTTPLHPSEWGAPTNPGPILEIDMVYATQAATDFLLGVQQAFWEVGVEMNLIYMERSPWSELCGDGWDDLVEYQFSYNCFELTYDQSLTMGLSPGMQKYASILIPGDYEALYDAMMVETDDATKENMFIQLNTMAIDKYCLVIPYFGYEIMSGRQLTVRDFGYGVASSEWCPEYGWLYEDQS